MRMILPSETNASTLHVETAEEVTNNEELAALLVVKRAHDDDDGDRCNSSSATVTLRPMARNAAADATANVSRTDQKENITITEGDKDSNKQQQHQKKLWLWIIIWTPLALCALLGPHMVRRLDGGAYMSLALITFVFTWGLWTGTQHVAMLMAPTLFSSQDLTEESAWEPTAAMILGIVFYQMLMICGTFEKERTIIRPSPALGNYYYPLATLPISYTISFLAWMMAVALLIMSHRVDALRIIMQVLSILSACLALFLFVEFALFLGRRGGGGGERSFLLPRRFLQDHHMASKHLLTTIARLVSMTFVLTFALVSNSWIQFAWLYSFLAAHMAATFLSSASLRATFQATNNSNSNNNSSFLNKSKPLTMGYFAPLARPQSMWALVALVALAIAIMLPLIVTLTYGFVQGLPDDKGKASSMTKEVWWLIILQVAAFLACAKLCLAAWSVIGNIPLQWELFVIENWVCLSVHTIGKTVEYHDVCQASSGIIISSADSSHITDPTQGVVTVEYDFVIRRGKNNSKKMPMTPEDPNVFLQMVARAIEQAKACP